MNSDQFDRRSRARHGVYFPTRAKSFAIHESTATNNPASRAFLAAFSSITPSCIQIAFAPIAIADSTIGPTNSDLLKTSTISTFSRISSSRPTAFSPNTSRSFGFTGIIRYPDRFKYSATPLLGRIRFDDSPTTAITLLDRSTLFIVSFSPLLESILQLSALPAFLSSSPISPHPLCSTCSICPPPLTPPPAPSKISHCHSPGSPSPELPSAIRALPAASQLRLRRPSSPPLPAPPPATPPRQNSQSTAPTPVPISRNPRATAPSPRDSSPPICAHAPHRPSPPAPRSPRPRWY